MLSATELAAMRATLTASLPDACTISRYAQVSDGQGGWVDTYSTASTTVCRVVAGGLTPQEQTQADKLTSQMVWVVTLPALTDISAKDRIIVNSTRTFEVVGVLAPRSWEISRRCICVENL